MLFFLLKAIKELYEIKFRKLTVEMNRVNQIKAIQERTQKELKALDDQFYIMDNVSFASSIVSVMIMITGYVVLAMIDLHTLGYTILKGGYTFSSWLKEFQSVMLYSNRLAVCVC